MISRIVSLAGMAASASFACVASTKCIPDVQTTKLTVVRGDVDAVLVSEFALANGCTLVEFDSLTRQFPALDTLPKRWAANSTSVSSAAALHLHTVVPKLDAAAAEKCSKVRTLRRIDAIPRATTWTTPVGTDLSVGIAAPVSLDSIAVCIDGSCSRIPAEEVDNKPDVRTCLVGMYAPQARDAALSTTRTMLGLADEVVTLQRTLFIPFPPLPYIPCRIRLDSQFAARSASMVPVTTEETRFAFPTSNASPTGLLAPLSPWSDVRVTKDLALPRPSNAGDYFSPETLDFKVTPLRSGTDAIKDSVFRYASGILYYQYQGFHATSGCDTAPSPTIVGDTLKLDGVSLQINNDGCGRTGIDGFANNYSKWLFAPRSSEWQGQFRHGSMLDNGPAWPFVGDSVQAFGWKFSLEELMGAAPSSIGREGVHPFAVRLSGRVLIVTLERTSPFRVVSPSGQILSETSLPAGTSRIALPPERQGVLLVGTGSRFERVVATR